MGTNQAAPATSELKGKKLPAKNAAINIPAAPCETRNATTASIYLDYSLCPIWQ